MAVFGYSLNAVIDGVQQTVLRRYTVPDDLIPQFFDYYARKFTPQHPPGLPPATQTDTFYLYAKEVVDQTQMEVRHDAEKTTAKNAIDAMPPPIDPIPS